MMIDRVRLFAVLLSGSLLAPAVASAQEPDAPLFQSTETIHLTLETDIDKLRRDRREESEYIDAVVKVALPSGKEEAIPLRVRTRGNFRLDRNSCWFPPVRLNFRKEDVAGTTFDGQDKLKLVTHCQQKDEYEQNVLEEYLVYRIYNLLTDISFRVRLVRMTYVDVNGGDDTITRYGFLIEDEDALAARFGGEILEMDVLRPAIFDPDHAAMMSVFEYMVGNTDFSMQVFHNVELLRMENGAYVPVPFDFDFTGLVNARYARPDPQFKSGSVRYRIYRGFCRPTVDFDAIYAQFNGIRDEVYEIVRSIDGITEKTVEEAIDYLDEFYEVINDPEEARRKITDACRDNR
jgi:hypothetical protein